jgi:2-haloalkanoic acid dehalogenase type II
MSRPYDIITFDCYGTLVDWRSGISAAFARAAAARGCAVDEDSVLELHTRFEQSVQQRPYTRYRTVLTEVERLMCRELGWGSERPEAFLANSVPTWPVFPDTNRALEHLKAAGYRLGILSNIDNDLLAATRRQFTVEFDLLVTAEDVRSYKPAEGHFRSARQLIGGNRWLHAAQSYYHDIVPAFNLGVSSVWINRLHERLSGVATPDADVANLDGLVEWLESVPRRATPPGPQRKAYMTRDE